MAGNAVVTLNTRPVIIFAPLADVCVGSSAVALSAIPSGGVFSGSFVSGNQFNPSTVGNYPITYNYTDPATGCVALPVTQNIDVIVCTPTWSGLANTQWNNPLNWVGNHVPGPADDAIIPTDCLHYPVLPAGSVTQIHDLDIYGWGVKSTPLSPGLIISGEIDGNLTITATGSVDLTAGGALTVNGNLSILGNLLVESQGSLITNGDVNGTAHIQRLIPNDLKWHFLSSPVSLQQICNGIFAPAFPGTFPGNINTWDFYNWLPGECDNNLHWRNLRKPDGQPNNVDFPLLAFQDNRGYLVGYGTGWAPIHEFAGTPNTADRDLAFYDVTNECSWALPGNPYPSAFAWSGVLLKENLIFPYYYIWNDNTQNYEWWGDATHFGGVKINGNIPAEQGFFIKVKPPSQGGGLHLMIPNSSRVHDNTTDTWIKTAVSGRLELVLSNSGNYSDKTYIMFENDAQVGQDRMDAEKLFSMNTDPQDNVPQIYTIINNDLKACSNSLPGMTDETTVPIGYIAHAAGTCKITVNGISGFSSLTGLTLEDLQLNVSQNLLQNPVYTFESAKTEDAGRFLLHFAGSIGIPEAGNNPVNIFSHEKIVYINCADGFKNAKVTISNLLGQVLLTQNLVDQTSNEINVNVTKGYYVVRVQSESSVKTVKVYIE